MNNQSYEVTQHFVTFYSPGTFVGEETTKAIDAWDISKALEMSKSIVERHGARPYSFQFSTRGRKAGELDSSVIAKSPLYYFGCRVETAEEIAQRNDSKEEILRSNLRCNGWKRIARPLQGYAGAYPLEDADIVL